MVSSTASFDVADDITLLQSETMGYLCCPLGRQQGKLHVDEAV
jgi:hypothetical protein